MFAQGERRSAIVYNSLSGNGTSFDAAVRLQTTTGFELLNFLELINLPLADLQRLVQDIQLLFVFSGDGSFLSLANLLQQLHDEVIRTMVACGGGGANVAAKGMGTNTNHMELVEQFLLGTLHTIQLSPFSVSMDGRSAKPATWTVNTGFSTWVLGRIEELRKAGIGDIWRRVRALLYAISKTQELDRVFLSRNEQDSLSVMGASVTGVLLPWWSDKIQFPVPEKAVALLQVINSPEAIGSSSTYTYMSRLVLELLLLTFGFHSVPRTIIESLPMSYGERIKMTTTGLVSVDSELEKADQLLVELLAPDSATNPLLIATRRK